MGAYASNINDLMDAHDTNADELSWIKAKFADVEDRSRRNNVKIRGIPEIIYHSEMLVKLMPDSNASDLIIDRIHCLPSHLSDQVPRDVMLCIHFYHVCKCLMTTVCNLTEMQKWKHYQKSTQKPQDRL